MNALFALTVANIKSYVRDRAALFWTLAFPLIFIFMFGFILQGGGGGSTLAWVDDDASPASTQLHDAFLASGAVKLVETTEEDALAQMRAGKVDAVIVARKGYGDAVAAGAAGTATAPAAVTVYTDPSRSNVTATVYQIVGSVLGAVNLGGRPPIVVPDARTIQTENLNFISYFVPSMLGLSVMQVGIFAAVPLVADREKLILKRLAATPLRRWQLVGSNVLMRLLIAMVQAIIIVGVGALFFGVQITGSVPLVVGFVVLGAMTFLSLGYVVASFAGTEDAANSMTSIIQFPMMFLSGTFFQIDQMPDVLQGIARIIPLTYLSDALRQVMVSGAAFAPLWQCAGVLLAWLAVCFGIAALKFRWQ